MPEDLTAAVESSSKLVEKSTKSALKTTEFWVSMPAVIMGFLVQIGVVAAEGVVPQIAAAVGLYVVPIVLIFARSGIKKGLPEALAKLAEIAKAVAPATTENN